jgi:trk system potassium uptake protein TrkA
MSELTDNIRRLSPSTTTNGDADPENPSVCYVLGGGPLGVAVARRLRAEGLAIALVDEMHDPAEIPGYRGDPSDVAVLTEAGLADAAAVVVATPRDERNLLVAQLVRTTFDVDGVFVLVHAPVLADVVAEAGHRPICVTSALSDAVAADLTAHRSERASSV